MLYHAIYHAQSNLAVVRPADHGVSENEWRHGCRPLHIFETFKSWVNAKLVDYDYEVLDDRQWSNFISSLDEPGIVPNNNFISTRVVRDKWDSDRPIY